MDFLKKAAEKGRSVADSARSALTGAVADDFVGRAVVCKDLTLKVKKAVAQG